VAGKKAALVTGAASGIGRSAALALARTGFDVVINYSRSEAAAREVAAEAEKLGAATLLAQCDVSDDAAVRRMLQAVDQRFGRLDVLVNNAGTTTEIKPKDFDGMTVEEWDRVFAVNVRGMFLVTRAALPLLRKGERPCIVNTASIVGLRPGPQPLPYAASKAAVVNLTKTLAYNLGPEIRVNAVAPGPVGTDLFLTGKSDALIDQLKKMSPLERLGVPEDIANLVSFLAGPEGGWINSQVLRANGGFA